MKKELKECNFDGVPWTGNRKWLHKYYHLTINIQNKNITKYI